MLVSPYQSEDLTSAPADVRRLHAAWKEAFLKDAPPFVGPPGIATWDAGHENAQVVTQRIRMLPPTPGEPPRDYVAAAMKAGETQARHAKHQAWKVYGGRPVAVQVALDWGEYMPNDGGWIEWACRVHPTK